MPRTRPGPSGRPEGNGITALTPAPEMSIESSVVTGVQGEPGLADCAYTATGPLVTLEIRTVIDVMINATERVGALYSSAGPGPG